MASLNKLKPSKALQTRYDAYKLSNRRAANKARKIAKHVKKHPNDAMAAQAINAAKGAKFRSKPNKKLGWVTETVKARYAGTYPKVTLGGIALPSVATSLTRQNAVDYAQVLKLESRVHMSYVLDTKGKDPQYVLRHVGCDLKR